MSRYIDENKHLMSSEGVNASLKYSWKITPIDDFLYVEFKITGYSVDDVWAGNFKLNFERDTVSNFYAYCTFRDNHKTEFTYYKGVMDVLFRKYSYIESSLTKACR